MFDIAFSELVVVGIVMLVVIGPKRLPEVARAAGRWIGALRRFVDDVKRDMDLELRKDELAELRQVRDQLVETRQLIQNTADSTFASIAAAPTTADPVLPSPVKSSPTVPRSPKKRKSTSRKKTAPAARNHGRTSRRR